MTASLGLTVLALLAFGAPSAMANSCNAPPGTSGIDQYCESIPSAGGNNGSHHKSGANKGGHLSPSTTKTLQQSGPAGATVLALTNGTAGTPASGDTATPAKKQLAKRHHRKVHHRAGTTVTTTPKPAAPQDTTPAGKTSFGVGDSLSGSLGTGFLVLMIVIAGLFGFLAWLSRRDRREPHPR